jgi:hypothetical protein
MTVAGDIAIPLSDIQKAAAAADTAAAAAAAQIEQLQQQNSALTQANSALTSEEATDQQKIASLLALIASVNPAPLVGAAFTNQADATKIGGNVYRQYNTPGKLPAPFTLNYTMPHLKLLIVSHKPDHPTFNQDAAYTAAITSLVAWGKANDVEIIVVVEHEPENKTKQPADSPANFSAEWRHYRTLAVAAGVPIENVQCVFMDYTLDSRPDTKGTNPWIVELAAELKAAGEPDPGGVGFDSYPSVSAKESLATAVLPNFAYARSFWPNCKVGIAEWGYSGTDADTAAHITQGLKDMKSVVGLRYISWFDEGGDNLASRPLSIAALQAGMTP